MLLKRLAVGGMAELFLANDTTSGAQVVIKRILPYLSHEPEFVQMFLDEARIAAQLHHANIIQVHELGKLQESMFIAMEFVDGIDLRKIFQEELKLGLTVPYGVAALVVAKVCSGLYYAHNAQGMDGRKLGVIHRDISPQNVMVAFDGGVKLVDFGIAKASALMDRSKPGVIKGKFLYLSPEQLSSERIDHRADLFALGAMLYELTTGKPPFYKPTTEAIIYAIRSEEPTPPTSIRSDFPPELSRIIMKCLVKDRTKRYQQADEIGHDLEVFLATTFPTDETALEAYVKRLFGKTDDESTRLAISTKKPSGGRLGPTQELPGRKASAAMPAAPAASEPISRPPSGAAPASNAEPVRAAPGLTRKPTITGGKQMVDPGEGLRTKLAGPGEMARAMSPTAALPMRKPSGAHYQGAGSGPPEHSVTHETFDGLPAAPPPIEDDEPDLTLPPMPRVEPAPLDDGDEDESTVPVPIATKARKGTPPPAPRNARLGVDPPVFDITGPVAPASRPPVDDGDDGLTPMATASPYEGDDDEENSTATVSDSPRAKPKRGTAGTTTTPARGGARKPSGAPVVLAIIALMLVAAGGVWWLASGDEAQAPGRSPLPAAAPVEAQAEPQDAPSGADAVEEPQEAAAEPEAGEGAEAAPPEPPPTPRAPLSTQRLTLVFDGPRGATVSRNGQKIPLGVAVEADPGLIEYQYRCPGKRATLKGAIQLDASAIGTPVHIPLSNCRR